MDTNSQPAKVCPKEAARQLGIGLAKLRQLRQAGQIGFQQLSERKIFYYQAEIDAFQETKKQPRYAI